MKTIKIKSCGECSYMVNCEAVDVGSYYSGTIHEDCPLKKEPIKLELADD